jgi:hypothetical protein
LLHQIHSRNNRRILISGHFCPTIAYIGDGAAIDKRDKFIAELRDEARKKGLPFKAEKWRGTSGHTMVFVGDPLTTVPSREIDPKTPRKIRKQLGLADWRKEQWP